MSADKQFLFRWAPRLIVVAFLLLFLVAAVYFLRDIIFADDSHKKNVIHEISLIKPPPPPKPEEKPPEPEVKKEEVKIPEPETPPPPADQPDNAKQDEPPPANDLGLDADGQAGSDSFGLGANKGGRSIIGGGGGNGGGGNRYGWYAGMIEKGIQDVLDKNKELAKDNYKVVIKVWVNKDGSVERFDLGGSSGNPETDKAIRTALKEMTRVKEPPPDGMPQPVKLRITSRLL